MKKTRLQKTLAKRTICDKTISSFLEKEKLLRWHSSIFCALQLRNISTPIQEDIDLENGFDIEYVLKERKENATILAKEVKIHLEKCLKAIEDPNFPLLHPVLQNFLDVFFPLLLECGVDLYKYPKTIAGLHDKLRGQDIKGFSVFDFF